MPQDTRNRFEEDVFTYRVTRDSKVLISTGGQIVTTLSRKNASQLIARLDGVDRREVQHLLARATGHYKHRN